MRSLDLSPPQRVRGRLLPITLGYGCESVVSSYSHCTHSLSIYVNISHRRSMPGVPVTTDVTCVNRCPIESLPVLLFRERPKSSLKTAASHPSVYSASVGQPVSPTITGSARIRARASVGSYQDWRWMQQEWDAHQIWPPFDSLGTDVWFRRGYSANAASHAGKVGSSRVDTHKPGNIYIYIYIYI